MRTRLQNKEFKYDTIKIGDVKLGLRVYSTTNACSGKIMVRLWVSMIEREMKERCKQGVEVRGSDKAARTA